MKKFRSTSGEVIVNMGKSSDVPNKIGDILYSADGIKFYQAICHGGSGKFGGDHAEFSVTFSVPQLGVDNTLEYTSEYSDNIVVADFIFQSTDMYINLKTVIKVPDTRECVYHYIDPETGIQIYVDDYKYSSSYDTFELCVKDKEGWVKVEITNVARYRDGGTTIIKTTDGELYVPTPFKPNLKATWNRLPLEKFVR